MHNNFKIFQTWNIVILFRLKELADVWKITPTDSDLNSSITYFLLLISNPLYPHCAYVWLNNTIPLLTCLNKKESKVIRNSCPHVKRNRCSFLYNRSHFLIDFLCHIAKTYNIVDNSLIVDKLSDLDIRIFGGDWSRRSGGFGDDIGQGVVSGDHVGSHVVFWSIIAWFGQWGIVVWW